MHGPVGEAGAEWQVVVEELCVCPKKELCESEPNTGFDGLCPSSPPPPPPPPLCGLDALICTLFKEEDPLVSVPLPPPSPPTVSPVPPVPPVPLPPDLIL
jgi:hypothetical protein